jgi:hypothetical protein
VEQVDERVRIACDGCVVRLLYLLCVHRVIVTSLPPGPLRPVRVSLHASGCMSSPRTAASVRRRGRGRRSAGAPSGLSTLFDDANAENGSPGRLKSFGQRRPVLAPLAAMAVLAGFVAGCAFTTGCALVARAWRDHRRPRRNVGTVEDPPPTPTADEVERWLRGRG